MWDVASGHLLESRSFSLPGAAICLSDDGERALAMAEPPAIWDLQQGKVLHTLGVVAAPGQGPPSTPLRWPLTGRNHPTAPGR